MDSDGEAAVIRFLQQAKPHKAIIIVSHRPSLMKLADSEYVLEGAAPALEDQRAGSSKSLAIGQTAALSKPASEYSLLAPVSTDADTGFWNRLDSAVGGAFREANELSVLIAPLLREIGWRGAARDVIEALPYYEQELDITGLSNALSRLGFRVTERYGKIETIDDRGYPCLVLPDNGRAVLLLEKRLDGYTVCDSLDQTAVQYEDFGNGRALFFERDSDASNAPTMHWTRAAVARLRPVLLQAAMLSTLIGVLLMANETATATTDAGDTTTTTETAATAPAADAGTSTAPTDTNSGTTGSSEEPVIPDTTTNTDGTTPPIGGEAQPGLGDNSGTVTENPGLSITKAVDKVENASGTLRDAVSAAGDKVTFSITVTNTGNTILGNVTVTDPLFGGLDNVVATGLSLAPGQSTTLTFTYTVTADEITTSGGGDYLIDSMASATSDQTTAVTADASVSIANNPPVFTDTVVDTNGNPSYSFQYAENSATTDVLGTVSASDLDRDTVSFSITGGNDDGYFAIDPDTGKITLTQAGVEAFTNDFEAAGNSHSLTVTASDGTNTTDITVNLTETNVKDVAPEFTNTTTDANNTAVYSFQYAENSATTDVLGTVSATDIEGDTVSFSITGGNDDGYFAIDPDTGKITLTQAGVEAFTNDFEAAGNSHSLTVTASDGTNTTDITVNLTETNVNEAPWFTNTNATTTGGAASYSFDYKENTASGTTLGTVSASDPDGNTLSYSIVGGSSWYEINSSTGAITLTAAGAASLANNFEVTPNSQTLTVRVFDGTNTRDIEVKLNELDVNETPSFTSTNSTTSGGAASYSYDYGRFVHQHN